MREEAVTSTSLAFVSNSISPFIPAVHGKTHAKVSYQIFPSHPLSRIFQITLYRSRSNLNIYVHLTKWVRSDPYWKKYGHASRELQAILVLKGISTIKVRRDEALLKVNTAGRLLRLDQTTPLPRHELFCWARSKGKPQRLRRRNKFSTSWAIKYPFIIVGRVNAPERELFISESHAVFGVWNKVRAGRCTCIIGG